MFWLCEITGTLHPDILKSKLTHSQIRDWGIYYNQNQRVTACPTLSSARQTALIYSLIGALAGNKDIMQGKDLTYFLAGQKTPMQQHKEEGIASQIFNTMSGLKS